MKYLKLKFELIENAVTFPGHSAIVNTWLGVPDGFNPECKLFMLDDYAKLLGLDKSAVKEAFMLPDFRPVAVFVSTREDNPIIVVYGFKSCEPTMADDFRMYDEEVAYYAMYNEDKTPIKISKAATHWLFSPNINVASTISGLEEAVSEFNTSN